VQCKEKSLRKKDCGSVYIRSLVKQGNELERGPEPPTCNWFGAMSPDNVID